MPDEKSVCELCFDTRMVIVPHPRFVQLGQWVKHGSNRPTAAVICTCRLAVHLREANLGAEKKDRQMTLTEYETFVSREYWKSLIAEDHAELLDRARKAGANKKRRSGSNEVPTLHTEESD